MDRARVNERRNLLGHEFSPRELQSVARQMDESTPLLDDLSVFFLGCATRSSKKRSPEEASRITILDPLFQHMLKENGDSYAGIIHKPAAAADGTSPYTRATAYFAENLADRITHYKLIPLHATNHWSLLYYDCDLDDWFHYDSLWPCHSEYATSFVQYLAAERIIGQAEASRAITSMSNADMPTTTWVPPRQIEGWECGFHTLMFMYSIIQKDMKPLDRSDYRTCAPAFLPEFRAFCRSWVAILASHIADDKTRK